MRRFVKIIAAGAGIYVLLSAGIIRQTAPWTAPQDADALHNPLKGKASATAEGKLLYKQYCTVCHGDKGKGDGPAGIALTPRPSDHSSKQVQSQTDGAIYWKITNGRASMASYKAILSEAQRWQLVDYIRELGTAPVKKKAKPVAQKTNSPAAKAVKTNPVPKEGPKPDNSKTQPSEAVAPKTEPGKISAAPEDTLTEELVRIDTIKPVITKTNAPKAGAPNADTTPVTPAPSISQDPTLSERNMERLQSAVPGKTKMMLTGVAWAGLQANLDNRDKTVPKINFNDFGFSPLFLWKLSDKFFFESEIEIQNAGDEENAAAVDLEFAKLSVLVNPYMTIGIGKMLTPFGAYGEKWEPNHIERFANAPLRPDDQFLPDDSHLFWGAVIGADVRGQIPAGNSKLSYAAYITNGPTLNTEPELGGFVQGENLNDQNNNKELGGRIGFLPFANGSLELGISGKHARAGGLQDSVYLINGRNKNYKDVASNAFAIDWNYTKAFSSLHSILGIKGQFTKLSVGDAYYEVPEGFTPVPSNFAPGDTSLYTYKNTMQSFFTQLSFRPAMVNNKFLKNLEFLLRYNALAPPKDAAWNPAIDENGRGGAIHRIDIGLDYWLSWRTGLRFSYEITTMPSGPNTSTFLARFATGL